MKPISRWIKFSLQAYSSCILFPSSNKSMGETWLPVHLSCLRLEKTFCGHPDGVLVKLYRKTIPKEMNEVL
jgi:hypothetical protein